MLDPQICLVGKFDDSIRGETLKIPTLKLNRIFLCVSHILSLTNIIVPNPVYSIFFFMYSMELPEFFNYPKRIPVFIYGPLHKQVKPRSFYAIVLFMTANQTIGLLLLIAGITTKFPVIFVYGLFLFVASLLYWYKTIELSLPLFYYH